MQKLFVFPCLISRTRFWLILVFTLLSSLVVNPTIAAEIDTRFRLFLSIDERLGYMENVALYKAQNQIAIEDIERERIVLADATQQAVLHGINPDSIKRFFVAQINAAKAIQYRYRAELLGSAIPSPLIDLQIDIRPALDKLGLEIIELLAELLEQESVLSDDYREVFKGYLNSKFLSDSDKNSLFDAMQDVALAH
jgi:chorismate mutase